jgi:hypothetical protein
MAIMEFVYCVIAPHIKLPKGDPSIHVDDDNDGRLCGMVGWYCILPLAVKVIPEGL